MHHKQKQAEGQQNDGDQEMRPAVAGAVRQGDFPPQPGRQMQSKTGPEDQHGQDRAKPAAERQQQENGRNELQDPGNKPSGRLKQGYSGFLGKGGEYNMVPGASKTSPRLQLALAADAASDE